MQISPEFRRILLSAAAPSIGEYIERPPETTAFTQTRTTELLPRMIACGLFADTASSPVVTPSQPPRIHSRSRHHAFAVHVLAGYPYEDACRVLGISPRTAERWRTDLRQTATHYFGRRVTYEFAARFALDPTLRAACESLARESPH